MGMLVVSEAIGPNNGLWERMSDRHIRRRSWENKMSRRAKWHHGPKCQLRLRSTPRPGGETAPWTGLTHEPGAAPARPPKPLATALTDRRCDQFHVTYAHGGRDFVDGDKGWISAPAFHGAEVLLGKPGQV